jgi:hypothetical protein
MLISLDKKNHMQCVVCFTGFLLEEYLSPQALVSLSYLFHWIMLIYDMQQGTYCFCMPKYSSFAF